MLGKWLRTTSRPAAEPEQPTSLEPTDDDLATILALVVVSDHDLGMIGQRTQLPPEAATAAVDELERLGAIADAGGGFYKATQGSCPGTCWRGGHELRGQEIVITPPGFEWWCAQCWDEERASSPAPGA
jgi:hypothetical protein